MFGMVERTYGDFEPTKQSSNGIELLSLLYVCVFRSSFWMYFVFPRSRSDKYCRKVDGEEGFPM